MFSNLGFAGSSVSKESACKEGDSGSIPGLGRSAGEGIGFPLQYHGFPGGSAGKESACNVGDLGSVPGLGRSLEEGMATHSSILAWRIHMDRGALAGHSPWGRKESDTTEQLSTAH